MLKAKEIRENMSKLKIEQPRIPYKLEEGSFRTIYEDEDFNLRNCLILDDSLEGEAINSPIFTQVIFENMNLINVSFENVELTDVIFKNCDLSNANFTEGSLFRVEFKGCKLLGIDLSNASLRHVTFEKSILDMSACGYSRFQQVQFVDCSLKDADLYECEFKHVEFKQCDLDEVNFAGTALKSIDLSSSSIGKLVVSVEDLTGCIVSSEQAIGFAALLGLVIKEES